jgi:hypothetical protein
MTPLERVLQRLDQPTGHGTQWQARCPAHDDRQPSLSISVGEDERVLLHCHAGCTLEAVCTALGLQLADLFVPKTDRVSTKPPKSMGNSRFRRRRQVDHPENNSSEIPSGLHEAIVNAKQRLKAQVSGVWLYDDAQGAACYAVVRFESAKKKTYRPFHRLDAQSWRSGDPEGPLPLYRLPDVLSASEVWVVEGEKCVEAARSIGLVSTTSAHGADSPQRTDWSPLAGKQVFLIPDHDEAGSKYANKVTKILGGLDPPTPVTLAEIPGLPESGDLVEYLEQHDAVEPETLRENLRGFAEAAAVGTPDHLSSEAEALDPFPVELFPEPVRRFVAEASRALGCEPGFMALPTLAVAAAAIGNAYRLELKPGWTEPAILWAVIVGESGTLKTPAFKLATAPIRELQTQLLHEHREAAQDYAEEVLYYERELSRWKRDKGIAKPPTKPQPPTAERLLVSDTTIEALAPILQQNPRGVLLCRDELAGWIGSFDRYASGKGTDASNWLSIHGGETLIVDRKTSYPQMLHVPRAAVSLIGGIQPGILAKYFDQEHRESGLAARLLMAWPPRRPKRWTDRAISPELEAGYADVIKSLYELPLELSERQEVIPAVMRLSPEAREVWIQFYNEHGQQQVELEGDLSAAWSKLEGYAARLTLVVHLLRWASGEELLGDLTQVDAASVQAGAALSRWFGAQARRVYAMLEETETQAAQRRLLDWISARGGRVTVREVQQGHRQFVTSDEARRALQRLTEKGMGRWETLASGSSGGRPSEAFVLRGSTDNDANS